MHRLFPDPMKFSLSPFLTLLIKPQADFHWLNSSREKKPHAFSNKSRKQRLWSTPGDLIFFQILNYCIVVRDMPWNRMNYKHSLPFASTRLISFTFVLPWPHFYKTCICMWKHCLWSGLCLFSCKTYCPDWFIFEPEALLLLLICIMPGLQQDPHLSEDPMKYRAHCTIQALNTYHLQCYWILWQLIQQHIKSFWAWWNFWWKCPVGCNTNVTKYRSYVLNVNQLNNIRSLFSTAKYVSSSCTWLLCTRL